MKELTRYTEIGVASFVVLFCIVCITFRGGGALAQDLFVCDSDTIPINSHLSGSLEIEYELANEKVYAYSIQAEITGNTTGRIVLKRDYDQIGLPISSGSDFGFTHPVFILKSKEKFIFDNPGVYNVKFLIKLRTGITSYKTIESEVLRVFVTTTTPPEDYTKITRQASTVVRAFEDYAILDDLGELVGRDNISPLLREYILYQAGGDYIVYGYIKGTVTEQVQRFGVDVVARWAIENCRDYRFICQIWQAIDEIGKGNREESRAAFQLVDPR